MLLKVTQKGKCFNKAMKIILIIECWTCPNMFGNNKIYAECHIII